jgi:CubicO group peptidase (beta-lactamase class C family)
MHPDPVTPGPVATDPNPELLVGEGDRPGWNQPDRRRHGFHHMPGVFRYSIGIRAPEVLRLRKAVDRRIGDLPSVRRLTGTTHFSAMVAARDGAILFEACAPDFGPGQPHSIQSITKTTMNLVYGQLVDQGRVDLGQPVGHYLPDIGSGYAPATVQAVLDMNVINDFSEDYSDPFASVFLQEAAMGWRLPPPGHDALTNRQFVRGIKSDDVTNRTGCVQYKSANTDVLGEIAERVSGRSLREMLIDIVEAAGLEGVFHMDTDREGTPIINGGACLTARDLARYALLFVRGGRGVDGRQVGSRAFIEATRRRPGVAYAAPRDWLRYSNETATDGQCLGHGGYGGQYMLANPDTGVVVVFFSVLENADAHDPTYSAEVIRMAEEVTRLPT